MKTALEWKKYYSSPEFRNNYIYNGNDLGVSCTDSGTSFKLWSPSADSVTLNLYQDGSSGKAFFRVPLKREKEGVWQWSTAERLHGVYYDFVLEIEGETVRSADPWARACGLNGQRSMAVNLKLTDPEGWELDRAPEKTREQIIYELHIKEFSWDASGGFPEKYRGKYKAFTCTDTTLNNDGIHPTGIRYLKDLGVTHIQIMPAYDYGSVDEAGKDTEFNWGYDPVNYNVPEGSYSTDPEHGEVRIREMKEMIQSLHSQGFRVIMDVVYNPPIPWIPGSRGQRRGISTGCSTTDMERARRSFLVNRGQQRRLLWKEMLCLLLRRILIFWMRISECSVMTREML